MAFFLSYSTLLNSPLLTHYFKILFLVSSSFFIRGLTSLRSPPLSFQRATTTTLAEFFSHRNNFKTGQRRDGSSCTTSAPHLLLVSTRIEFRRFDRMSSTMNVAEGSHIKQNLQDVRRRIQCTLEQCGRGSDNVRLVAVSKTKPVAMLAEAYEEGQRCFGENYAQELIAKAEDMSEKYPGIEWHFIGPLQSNKASPLIKHVGKNLKCVETVSTLKLAQKLDRAVEEFIKPEESESSSGGDAHRLHIFLQIDTSGEETKSGIDAQDAPLLATEIASKCPHLSVEGVMTIGAPGDFNCFDALVACRKNVAEALGCPPERLALSMGMSGDFEEAIKRGATTVRVGSTIFGERDYSKKS